MEVIPVSTASCCQLPASRPAPSVQARKRGGQMEKTHNTEGLGSENISMFFSNSIANKKGFLPRPAPFRGWTQGTEDNAGGWQNDTVREIWAKLCDFYGGINMSTDGALPAASVLSMTGYAPREDLVMRRTGVGYFRASNIVPTGPVTAPPHIWQPVIMYLGLPA